VERQSVVVTDTLPECTGRRAALTSDPFARSGPAAYPPGEENRGGSPGSGPGGQLGTGATC